MRHRVAGRRLSRDTEHRRAMRRNLAASLFEHETISTTVQKAKEVKPFAEKLITLAKKGDLAARRRAISLLGNRDIIKEQEGSLEKTGTVIGKLFSELGPRYLDRPGGYTRIIRLSQSRLGDNGQICLLQLVGTEKTEKETTKKKSRRKAKREKAVGEAEQIEQQVEAVEAESEQEPVEESDEQQELEDKEPDSSNQSTEEDSSEQEKK